MCIWSIFGGKSILNPAVDWPPRIKLALALKWISLDQTSCRVQAAAAAVGDAAVVEDPSAAASAVREVAVASP